ncbi:hypothetical protein QGO_3370 [Clostridioides difficile CD212]|nr:hypothetical protein QGO_3370 [Clostridioides difficile CD212]EQG07128.1 hypothetical protein QI7_1292 [Clostridioides difficile 6042]EQG89566.1 hypothetical protein QKK_3766 [Clostridioides difficile DA00191]EQH18197.1 hypothetical protein QM1_3641 [Clostridioides difficile DA00212]EQJ76328.1 hypothetical protein QU7_3530 [Clostridioides difficile P46]EQK19065.1 hypothetical protein QUY_3501 [Clostridioides difficile P71]EQK28702.1 hypothetical protein QW3_3517 [Clostridioides difficile P
MGEQNQNNKERIIYNNFFIYKNNAKKLPIKNKNYTSLL